MTDQTHEHERKVTVLEAREIATQASEMAVARTFELLGINIASEESRERFRENQKFLGRQRDATEEAGKMMKTTIWRAIPLVLLGFMGWFWLIFTDGFRAWLIDFLGGGPK